MSENKVKRYFGEGTYGIIIGCPRLPSDGETLDELSAASNSTNQDSQDSQDSQNSQVSKVIKDRDDIQKIIKILELINQRFSPTNLAQLQTQIVIPSRPQFINWHELARIPEEIAFLRSHKITKRRHKWQYLMERGTADLEVELRSVSTLNEFKHFLKGFSNIIDGIAALHTAGLVHTDLKLTNMILSMDGRYKLIDLDEIGDATCYPSDKAYFEKIYHNPYYPYYSPAGVFLWAFNNYPSPQLDDKFIDILMRDLIKQNYDSDYHQYFKDISQNSIQLINDPELTNIILGPYENDAAMRAYLTDFKTRIEAQPSNITAHRELLLFIDRYALGINLLILLNKYYYITGQHQKTTTKTDTGSCEFIPQTLIAIIKLCCSPGNYGAITTAQIADEYRRFITQLFRRFPFKFIIKLLSGLVIRRRASLALV